MASDDVHHPAWSLDAEVAQEDVGLLGGASQPSAPAKCRIRQSHVLGLWACSVVATAALTRHLSLPNSAAEAPSSVKGIQQKDIMPRGWSATWKTFWPQLWEESLRNARFVDLTHTTGIDSPTWRGFGGLSVGPAEAGGDMGSFISKGEEFSYPEQGFIATRYNFSSDQLGTQLDPPAHWNEYGATISDLPATFSVRPLVVIDVSSKVQDDAEYELTVEDVREWEASYGDVPHRSVVFVRTDYSKSWDQYRQQGLSPVFPGVGLEALQFLHETRHILFHGHEPLETDATPGKEAEAWLMHNHYPQAEGLKNLDQVPPHGCLLNMGFAKPMGGTGGLARFVAICPGTSDAGGTTLIETPGMPLPQQTYPLRRRRDGVLVPTQGEEDSEYCLGPHSLGCRDGNPVWVDGLPA